MNDGLRGTIDRLGEVRERIAELAATEKKLAGVVRKALSGRKDPVERGDHYIAQLLTVESIRITSLAALKRAAGKQFLEVVRADVAAARKVLGDEAVAALGKPTRSRRLTVTRLKDTRD